MTFKGIVWKNFKYGIQKNLAFFLCSTLTIAIFFIFSNLSFSKEIDDFMNSTGMGVEIIFPIMVIVILIFSLGFISYISNSKNKSRSKEFGLYMTMGMSQRDISKLIIIEDLFLGSTSIVLGTLIGMIFSRLVYMITTKIIASEGNDFALNYKSFLLTAIVFIGIYLINIVITVVLRRKTKIKDLITSDRKSEYSKKSFVSLAVIGLAMMLTFAGVAIASTKSRNIAMNSKLILAAITIGILGAFLVISNIIGIISGAAKKDKGVYAKNLMSISELKYTSKKNEKVLFILSLLSAMILFSSASMIALLNMCDTIVDSSPIPNISYVDAYGVNSFQDKEVDNLINESGAVLKEHKTYECTFVYKMTETENKDNFPICIINATSLSKMIGNNETILDNEAKILATDLLMKPEESKLSELKINNGSIQKDLKLLGTIISDKFSTEIVIGNRYLLVVSDKTFIEIEKNAQNNGTIHNINVDNWRKTGSVFDRLSQIRDSNNQLSNHFTLSGSYIKYDLLKRLYSTFVFVMNFISILFFAASILILLFRQYENVDKMAKKYSQLRKIGLTRGEFKKFVGSQTRFIFIVPLIFGLFIGACLQLIMQSLAGGNEFYADFWKTNVLVATIYILLQLISCKAVTSAYFKRIISVARVK